MGKMQDMSAPYVIPKRTFNTKTINSDPWIAMLGLTDTPAPSAQSEWPNITLFFPHNPVFSHRYCSSKVYCERGGCQFDVGLLLQKWLSVHNDGRSSCKSERKEKKVSTDEIKKN